MVETGEDGTPRHWTPFVAFKLTSFGGPKHVNIKCLEEGVQASRFHATKATGGEGVSQPRHSARELQRSLSTGDWEDAPNLALELGVSRARMTHLLRVLRLAPTALEKLEDLGDRWHRRVVGEHSLRALLVLVAG